MENEINVGSKIKDLRVGVEDKEIIKWISIDFEVWKNYCLLWKNWSGKSTLSSFLMWHPKYEWISWEINIDNEKLLDLNYSKKSCSMSPF